MAAHPLYSIGHSNHSLARFFELLRAHEIEVVADVRSKPYSRYTQHFHGPVIQKELQKAGFKYVFLGKELGGMPDDRSLYDEDGNLDYERVAHLPSFAQGFERLLNGVQLYTVTLMCGEENPSDCHRRHLLAKQLAKHNIVVQHIRSDGRIETEDDFVSRETPDHIQLDLFG